MRSNTLQSFSQTLLRWIYPEICQICGKEPASVSQGLICDPCWTRPGNIRFIRPPFCERCGLPYDGDIHTTFVCGNCQGVRLYFSQARSAVTASGLVREVIHRFKYRRAVWFVPFLADLLYREAGPVLRTGGWDTVVPVPLHPVRERERENNQAALIGRALASRAGLAILRNGLRRVRDTGTQTLLSRDKRMRNMQSAFETREGLSLKGRRIVIVDDVFTTGATTNACARVLRRAGAKAVCVWTVARGV